MDWGDAGRLECATCKKCICSKKTEAHQENPVVLSLARAGVKVRDLSKNEGQIAESYYNYNLVDPGDLLLNPMDLYSGANCSVSNVKGVISQAYINLRAQKGYNSKFYDYYLKHCIGQWLCLCMEKVFPLRIDGHWGLKNCLTIKFQYH